MSLVVVGGRQVDAIVSTFLKYNEGMDVRGEEMITDLLKNKENYREIKNIVLLDSGMYSLKEINEFKEVVKYFRRRNIRYYTRYQDLLPKDDFINENVEIEVCEGIIPISEIAKLYMVRE